MYVIEVGEDKMQNLAEKIGKALRVMGEVMSCVDEMSHGEYNERNGSYGGGYSGGGYNERNMMDRMRYDDGRYNERSRGYGRYR